MRFARVLAWLGLAVVAYGTGVSIGEGAGAVLLLLGGVALELTFWFDLWAWVEQSRKAKAGLAR